MFELPTAWLVTYLCHSSVLLGLAWALTRRVGSERLALQETLWRAALLGAVLTASLQLAAGWSSPLLAGGGEPAIPAPVAAFTVVPAPPSIATAPAAATPAAGSLAESAIPWRPALLAIWWTGMLVLGGRLLRSQRRLARRLANRRRLEGGRLFELFRSLVRSLGCRGRMALTSSEGLEVPIARGVLRREVCLPERLERELSDEQQETVLAHEIAHLARRDPSWLLIYRLVEAALFVQPLNRLAVRRLGEIAEYRCDDWAVERTGRPLALARCLTRVADWAVRPNPPIAVPSMAARGSGLERRVRRLLEREGWSAKRSPGWLPLAVVAALLATVILAPGGAPLLASASEPAPAPAAPAEVATPPETAPEREAPPLPHTPQVPEAPPAPAVPVLVAGEEQAVAPEPPTPPGALRAPATEAAPPTPPAVAVEPALPSGQAPPSPTAPWAPRTAPRPERVPVPVAPTPSARPRLAPPAAAPRSPRLMPPRAVLAPGLRPGAVPEAPIAVVSPTGRVAALDAPLVAVLPSPPGVDEAGDAVVVAPNAPLAVELEAVRARQRAEEARAEVVVVRERERAAEREALQEARAARRSDSERRIEARQVAERAALAERLAVEEARLGRIRDRQAERLRGAEAASAAELERLDQSLTEIETRLEAVEDRLEELDRAAAAGGIDDPERR